MAEEIKRKDDYVKLVNKTDKAHTFTYDGAIYTIGDKPLVLVRYIAEHGIHKTSKLNPTGREHNLEIAELPISQRSPGISYETGEENTALKKEKDELRKAQDNLKDENETLRKEVEKLKKKLDK